MVNTRVSTLNWLFEEANLSTNEYKSQHILTALPFDRNYLQVNEVRRDGFSFY
jgi:hypothetical protein